MNRLLFFASVSIALCSYADAQGLATNKVERSAAEMLFDFAARPHSLTGEHSVVIREKKISYIDGRDTDLIYLFCEDRRKSSSGRFSATGAIGEFVGIGSEERRWVQYLKTRTHRAQRSGGSAFGKFSGEVVEAVTMDPEDSRILRFPRSHDYPFFRPIAPHADVSARRLASASYGRYLVDDLDFMGAKKIDSGKIQSDWSRGLWRVQITFDPKQGNSPTKVVHFGSLDLEDAPMISVHVIEWAEWKREQQPAVWVPVSYQFRHSTPDYGMDYGIEGHLRWADTSRNSVMPKLVLNDDSDWREEIREQFDEDWSDGFSLWQQRKHGNFVSSVAR